nr:hypothetical protein [uncultured Kingella sp.]
MPPPTAQPKAANNSRKNNKQTHSLRQPETHFSGCLNLCSPPAKGSLKTHRPALHKNPTFFLAPRAPLHYNRAFFQKITQLLLPERR